MVDQDPSFNPELLRGNVEGLPVEFRTIVSGVIISADGQFLMGRKDPSKGGVYPDAWHIPGGGVEKDETQDEAFAREMSQEVVGLDLETADIAKLPFTDYGSSPKTKKDGTRVWVVMEFNRYEVRLPDTAEQLADTLRPGDDLVELQFFTPEELVGVEQIPGGLDAFRRAGYIPQS